jgi:hypothetical protein
VTMACGLLSPTSSRPALPQRACSQPPWLGFTAWSFCSARFFSHPPPHISQPCPHLLDTFREGVVEGASLFAFFLFNWK